MDDLLADFIEETRELLEAIAGEMIAWEADPADRARLDTIFRFVHTVKGNCGFFDLPRLERLSHTAEDALADVRKGRREADAPLVSAVLAIIDRISQMVDALDAGDDFPEGGDDELIAALADEAGEAVAIAPAPVPDRSGAPANASSSATPRSIRLPVDLLDRVMSGVSDMVLARNDLAHRLREAGTQPTIDGPFERLTSILTDVRDAVTRMRMQRIDHLFSAFPRLVRDLSGELGKQVMLDIDGGDVELDREMIEMIRDPMTHIIRNAIDHGFEPPATRLKSGKREFGLLTIAARQSGNTISIVISDDGKGLDQDRIATKAVEAGLVSRSELKAMTRDEILQFVFAPGLSTAEQITAVSGRGVGLDVVRANLEKVGGAIEVASEPGIGSQFTLRIPLTLSIIAGITVEAAGQHFAIPQGFVEEIVHGEAAGLERAVVGDAGMVSFRGQRVPCLHLAQVLKLDEPDTGKGKVLVMLKLAQGDLFALAVDAIHNHADLVVKPLAPAVMRSRVFAGSTLLDNGRPILMLDIPNIAELHGLLDHSREFKALTFERRPAAEAAAPPELIMLFRGWDGIRRGVRLELVHRIETVPCDAIDFGMAAPQAVIDGEIVPMVGMDAVPQNVPQVRMLRLSDGTSEVLYAVAKVEDAVPLASELAPSRDDPAIEGMALVDGKPVPVVDGHTLFARHGAVPRPISALTCHLPTGDWAQAILAPLVKAAGYRLAKDAASADVAIVIDAQTAPAEKAAIVRLRSLPDVHASDEDLAGSIYRYDRDGVLKALRAASRGIAA
ncbi:chemotaxis protein CheA [Altererythrobacter sp. BO-6]|uniref:chemotaxis protein CheA n=1 Tax=Altererythrobacter sp. BO-6 TaxID=2604537 RepID=UPI0013E1A8A4|nr:chemotaxis protein CheA [Altererythrobacter sp. BO-6]QIG54640.1 chemotaxis protein CheA [Altererythrobacter sp. BO-6]